MEDESVLSLKSAARRGGIASLAALSALALASCSAGQITQTSSKVTAVDGASADSEDGTMAVRDVTIILDEQQDDASLKFTAINQDPSMVDHTLESVEVEGQQVDMDSTEPLQTQCSLVAASEQALSDLPQFDEGCISYSATTLENRDFAIGGNLPVLFTFDNTTIELLAPVSMAHPEVGEATRDELTDSLSDNEPMLGESEGH